MDFFLNTILFVVFYFVAVISFWSCLITVFICSDVGSDLSVKRKRIFNLSSDIYILGIPLVANKLYIFLSFCAENGMDKLFFVQYSETES